MKIFRVENKELHEFLIDIDAWSDVFDKNPVSKLLCFTLKGTVDFRSDRTSKWSHLGVANWPTGNSPAHLHKFCCLGLYSQAAKEILNCDNQARKVDFVEQCGMQPSQDASLEQGLKQCLEKAIRHFQTIETYILDSQNKAVKKIAAELKIKPHQVQTTCAQGQGNFDTYKWLAPDFVARCARAAVNKEGVRVVRIYQSGQQFLSETIENPNDIHPEDVSFILYKERPSQWPTVETGPQDETTTATVESEGSTSEAPTSSQETAKAAGKIRKVSRVRSKRIESSALVRRNLRASTERQENNARIT